jgi:hypothetical protein
MGPVICGLVIAIPIVLLIGAAILRAAVALANATIGDVAPARDPFDSEFDGDDDRGYRRERRRPTRAVPEPGLGWGMLIVLVVGLVNFLAGIPIRLAFGLPVVGGEEKVPVDKLLVIQAIGLPVGFLVAAWITGLMLPTTFARACLVVLYEYLVVIAIVAVIAGGFYALGVALG